MRLAGPEPFVFDRRFTFGVTPDELWRVLLRTDDYARWWPWLRSIEVDRLAPGAVAECVVRAPVGYPLRFSLLVEDVVPAERIVVAVRGDVEGPARLDLTPAAGGCQAHLVWTLHVRRPALRRAALVARPVLTWGHEWVVGRGVAQFRSAALGGAARPSEGCPG